MSGTRPRMQRAIQCRRSVKSDDGISFLGRRASRENLIDGDRQATGLSVRGRCSGRPSLEDSSGADEPGKPARDRSIDLEVGIFARVAHDGVRVFPELIDRVALP